MSGWAERLGWMLIHSLWIGALAALGLRLVLAVIPDRAATLRHAAGCVALAAMALLPWWTFASSDFTSRMAEASIPIRSASASVAAVPEESAASKVAPAPASAIVRKAPDWSAEAAQFLKPCLPWLTGVWSAGVLFCLVLLGREWRRAGSLAQEPLLKVSAEWEERFAVLCCRAGIDGLLRFGESARVSVPMVAGWLKPVILFPVGVTASLPVAQVEAILLHELAHIRRHDAWVNLLQAVCEALFFYHPAVWYIGRILREEREKACDDLVVAWSGDSIGYAEALVAFEGARGEALALAASGEGELLSRVRRLLGMGPEKKGSLLALTAAAVLLGVGLYLGSMFLLPFLSAKAMTAAERIASIKASQPEWEKPVDPAKKVRLIGTLRTEDGGTLPRAITLIAVGRTGNSTAYRDVDRQGEGFSSEGEGVFVRIFGRMPGYAPFSLRLPDAKDGVVGPIEVVVRKGIASRLRVVTEAGAPVPGVRVDGWLGAAADETTLGVGDFETAADGTVSVGQVAADTKAKLTFAKPGWQKIEVRFDSWQEGRTPDVVLRPSVPANGSVVDKETGKPIEGADIQMAAEVGSDGRIHNSMSPDLWPPEAMGKSAVELRARGMVPTGWLARTDAGGRFTVNDLSEEMNYRVYVRAPGHPLAAFPLLVKQGAGEQRFALDKGVRVEGKILHPRGFDGLGKPPAEIACVLSVAVTEQQSIGYEAKAKLLPGSSPEEMTFVFGALPAPDPKGDPQFVFQVGEKSFAVDPRKGTDDCVLDLGAKRATRRVELSLDPGKGQPMAAGALKLWFMEDGTAPGIPRKTVMKELPLADGRVAFDVVVPNQIVAVAGRLLGYWLPRTEIDVSEDAGTLSKALSLIPAGVVRGKVIASAEAPAAKSFFTHVEVVKEPPALKNQGLSGGSSFISDDMMMDRYQTSPLPPGGTYRVILSAGNHYEVGEAVEIDAAHPIVEREMRWHVGAPVRGTFVDADGKPASGVETSLSYSPSPKHIFGTSGVFSGRDGSFSFEGINFDVPGHYEVVFKDAAGKEVKTPIDRPEADKPLVIVYPTGEKR